MANKLLMIRIDEDLHGKFKNAAAYCQTLMTELLIEFIEKVVEKVESKKLDIKLAKKLLAAGHKKEQAEKASKKIGIPPGTRLIKCVKSWTSGD